MDQGRGEKTGVGAHGANFLDELQNADSFSCRDIGKTT
jgi:hypothetical protein